MRKSGNVRHAFVLTAGSVLSAILIVAMFAFLGSSAKAQSQASTNQLQQLSQTFRDVAKAVSPAVVYISTEQTVKADVPDQFGQLFGDEFFRHFFGVPDQQQEFSPFFVEEVRRHRSQVNVIGLFAIRFVGGPDHVIGGLGNRLDRNIRHGAIVMHGGI